ncbi:hypothetical protein GCM10007894_02030 [Paraferrimonas haliotis]|uniref:Thioredoxin domain-containing protein n=2 Tax=Paraferrimonas haliotis TaxID=2013866 RepID=A0AA37TUV8_9GAMM|nr:hypothetical protein GCM10007894_02030 [Paraferrimonas haliotis]
MIMTGYTDMDWARSVRDVTFTDLQGNSVSFADHKGKLLMVNLWATWCSPCLKEIPMMKKIAEANKDNPFAMIPISIDEHQELVEPFLEKYGFSPYDTWLDPNSDIEEIFPANIIPATIMFDARGNMIGFARGLLDWSDKDVQPYLEKMMQKYVVELLAEEDSE